MIPIIYVFCNQANCTNNSDWHTMIALTEDGKVLASHVCSSHAWANHDMGISEDGWKRDIYKEHYPNGFEVKWIEGEEMNRILAEIKAKIKL